jgi:hypothetical protein
MQRLQIRQASVEKIGQHGWLKSDPNFTALSSILQEFSQLMA